ncbi:class I SAM-dependent methyltransferase [Brevundimonas sp.]|uniref:class I SAM-dependent methyltransferase n=1 Tax=Brevundimonas sp. TaxID=1871086 RepID=UPI003F717FF5
MRRFILDNLHLTPAPSRPDIRLYAAHAASGLDRLSAADDAPAPYWAYGWGGGAALAFYLQEHPEAVAGRRVLDLGCGSGLVGVAAMKAGAALVLAVDIDPHAVVATQLNAEANGVAVETMCADLLDGPPPAVEVVLAGDVFYSRALARRSLPFLRRCRDAGLSVLIGDPGRASLPRTRLTRIAAMDVPDFGEPTPRPAGVYELRSDARG